MGLVYPRPQELSQALVHRRGTAHPHLRQRLAAQLPLQQLLETVPHEAEVQLFLGRLRGRAAEAEGHLHPFAGGEEGQLQQREFVDVVEGLEGGEEAEGVLREEGRREDGTHFAEPFPELGAALRVLCLKQQVDQVAEGQQPGPSGDYDDSAFGEFPELQPQPLFAAET